MHLLLGGVVTAREIYADFWVNRRGRTVTPVGFLPCGKVTVNADCDETGGNSRAGSASPDVGTVTISAANEIGPEVTLPFDEAANFRCGTGTAVLRRVK